MSEKRRALGRGLGALHPQRPDRDRRPSGRRLLPGHARPARAGRRGTVAAARQLGGAAPSRTIDAPTARTTVTAAPEPRLPPATPRRDAGEPPTRTRQGLAPVPGRHVRRDPGRRRSARTRVSRAPSSTRTSWPSWCTRSARSGCCSPSWSGPFRATATATARTRQAALRAHHGRAPLARHPGGRPGRPSRRSSRRPTTTTCCATPCWRTCTAAS